MEKKCIEVCFSPALYQYKSLSKNYIVVLVDVLRATTAICAAFENEVEAIIPVAGIEKAKEFKNQGFLVAAERDGIKLEFADFGNSPFNFQKEIVKGKTIAYSTTNGTQALAMVNDARVVIGAFSNLNALSHWIAQQKQDVLILCAGWKNKFNLEDSLFAGALAYKLINSFDYSTNCDSAHASIDIWHAAKDNLIEYARKCAHLERLRKFMLDDVFEFCFTLDTTECIPMLMDGKLKNIV